VRRPAIVRLLLGAQVLPSPFPPPRQLLRLWLRVERLRCLWRLRRPATSASHRPHAGPAHAGWIAL